MEHRRILRARGTGRHSDVLFWRSLFGGLSIVALAMILKRSLVIEWRRAFVPAGIAMMALNIVGMMSFVYALQNKPEGIGIGPSLQPRNIGQRRQARFSRRAMTFSPC